MSARVCIYCGKPNGPGVRELRPYGPGGSDVCAGCIVGEGGQREKAAKKEFARQLRESTPEGSGVVSLTESGPEPLCGVMLGSEKTIEVGCETPDGDPTEDF